MEATGPGADETDFLEAKDGVDVEDLLIEAEGPPRPKKSTAGD